MSNETPKPMTAAEYIALSMEIPDRELSYPDEANRFAALAQAQATIELTAQVSRIADALCQSKENRGLVNTVDGIACSIEHLIDYKNNSGT